MVLTLADQSSHQVVKHGNAPAIKVSTHKAHGAYHATVHEQPHAAPQDVHNPYAGEKYGAAVHAPAHVPVHPAPYHPAPFYPALPLHKPAPLYHPAPAYKPAPVYKPAPAPAPVYKPAPAPAPVYKPAPAPAPVYKPAPAPVYKPAPAPAYKPAPTYHEPVYEDAHPAYNYAYAVKDDYAGLHFGADETRDGYNAHGNYHVLLPDGRTQTVTYTVDGYGGYVADVKYSGEAKYAEPAPTYNA